MRHFYLIIMAIFIFAMSAFMICASPGNAEDLKQKSDLPNTVIGPPSPRQKDPETVALYESCKLYLQSKENNDVGFCAITVKAFFVGMTSSYYIVANSLNESSRERLSEDLKKLSECPDGNTYPSLKSGYSDNPKIAIEQFVNWFERDPSSNSLTPLPEALMEGLLEKFCNPT